MTDINIEKQITVINAIKHVQQIILIYQQKKIFAMMIVSNQKEILFQLPH